MSAELTAAAPAARLLARLARRLSPWRLLLAASFAVLAVAAVALGVLWLTSARTASASWQAPPGLLGIELRVEAGDVTIVGGSRTRLSITRSDRSAFGHAPRERSVVRDGILRVASTCPDLVVGSCASSYRLDVPDNVPISIRAGHGSVRLVGYHGSADIATNSGSITVDGYCGFVLGAASASGDVTVASSCSPDRLALRSNSGDVSAAVPSGNYQVDAVSSAGRAVVTGVVDDSGAPWTIQALSNSGSVRVEGTS